MIGSMATRAHAKIAKTNRRNNNRYTRDTRRRRWINRRRRDRHILILIRGHRLRSWRPASHTRPRYSRRCHLLRTDLATDRLGLPQRQRLGKNTRHDLQHPVASGHDSSGRFRLDRRYSWSRDLDIDALLPLYSTRENILQKRTIVNIIQY